MTSHHFLPPHSREPSPLETCRAERCRDCSIRDAVHCHFGIGDLARFLGIAAPGIAVGALAIRTLNSEMLVPWALACAAFFGLVEIRVLCSHCPHYAQPGGFLRCWANYGSPKLWRYRPGPLSQAEKWVLLSGFGILWGYPLILTLFEEKWFLATALGVTTGGFYLVLRHRFCSRCMNFACPLNRVPATVRHEFVRLNPSTGEWSG